MALSPRLIDMTDIIFITSLLPFFAFTFTNHFFRWTFFLDHCYYNIQYLGLLNITVILPNYLGSAAFLTFRFC